jgi:hypothetical protein
MGDKKITVSHTNVNSHSVANTASGVISTTSINEGAGIKQEIGVVPKAGTAGKIFGRWSGEHAFEDKPSGYKAKLTWYGGADTIIVDGEFKPALSAGLEYKGQVGHTANGIAKSVAFSHHLEGSTRDGVKALGSAKASYGTKDFAASTEVSGGYLSNQFAAVARADLSYIFHRGHVSTMTITQAMKDVTQLYTLKGTPGEGALRKSQQAQIQADANALVAADKRMEKESLTGKIFTSAANPLGQWSPSVRAGVGYTKTFGGGVHDPGITLGTESGIHYNAGKTNLLFNTGIADASTSKFHGTSVYTSLKLGF